MTAPDLGHLATVTTRLKAIRDRIAALDAERDTLVTDRDTLIRSARQAGATYTDLEAVTGLSRATLDIIIHHRRR